MATYQELTEVQTDEGSPIDEDLMRGTAGASPTGGVRGNLINHEDRITALEGAGGASGGGSVSDMEMRLRYANVVSGFETDEAKFFRKRFSISQTNLRGVQEDNLFGFDPEGEDQSGSSSIVDQDPVGTWSNGAAASAYRGTTWQVPKSSKFEIKVKKGHTFFGIGFSQGSSRSDGVEITFNDQTPTALGLTDETGAAQTNSFTTVSATTKYQRAQWFFGLDPDTEYSVKILNNDSGSDVFEAEFYELGFASPEGQFSPDKTVHISAGRANVRGTSIDGIEGDFTFDAANGYGRMDALKIDTAGTITALKGNEPAFTQAEPESAISFSGAVTSLSCKNVHRFPSTGFLMVQTFYGEKHMASYTSKTGDLLGSFDGLVWQTQPSEDFTPLDGFSSSTTGDATGDLSVCLWAGGGINVSASNNKIDFGITIAGTTTSHSATVASGLYSADIVPLQAAIISAMNTAKDLSAVGGEYFVEYNMQSHRWTIGVKSSSEISEITFPVSTGANTLTNLMSSSMGFAVSDISGATSYRAGNEVESLAERVYRESDFYYDAEDPRIKYTDTDAPASGAGNFDDAEQRLGFGTIRRFTNNDIAMKIFPEDGVAGLILAFLKNREGYTVTVAVEDDQIIYAQNMESVSVSNAEQRAAIGTYFIPLPQGTNVVSIRLETEGNWSLGGQAQRSLVFIGAKPVYLKPAEERLTTSEGILRSFMISPQPLYFHSYTNSYSAAGSNDNVDTSPSFTGSWTVNTGSGTAFTQLISFTNTQNDTADITFTIANDGGGVAAMFLGASTRVRKVGAFLVSGSSASETGTRIQNISIRHAAQLNNVWQFRILDLPAGQYTLRLKHEDSTAANQWRLFGWGVIDEVIADRGPTHSALSNTGQGVAYPIRARQAMIVQDAEDRVPNRLAQSGYREGIAQVDTELATFSVDDNDDAAGVYDRNGYFGQEFEISTPNQNFKTRFFGHAKTIAYRPGCFSTYASAISATIDGIAEGANISTQEQVKGGLAPSTAGALMMHPIYSRTFSQPLSSDMSDSTTCPVADTRGFKVGSVILVSADGQATLRRKISAITTSTSVTLSEAITGFANYTTANNAAIRQNGLHSLELENTTSVTWAPGSFVYEPLDITKSDNEDRLFRKFSKIGEVSTLTFKDVASGDDLSFPVFTDGRYATWAETSVNIIAKSSGSATYSLDQNLKNVTISAGTLDIKLTAVRRF